MIPILDKRMRCLRTVWCILLQFLNTKLKVRHET